MTENNHSRRTLSVNSRSFHHAQKTTPEAPALTSWNARGFATLSCGGCGQVAGGANVELDGVFHAEDEGAGVLQPPFLVGNREVGGRGGLRACHLDGDWKRKVVVLPVKAECAGDFHLRRPLRVEGSFDLRWREDNFGILLALQNFAVHFRIASVVAAVPASGVDHDRAAGLAR